MWQQIQHRLFPPTMFDAFDADRPAAILRPFFRILALLTLIYLILCPFLYPNPLTPTLVSALTFLAVLGGIWLLDHGAQYQAGLLICGMLWLVASISIAFSGGVYSPVLANYVIVVLIAGLALGERAGYLATALCIATATGLLILESAGRLPESVLITTPPARLITQGAILLTTAILIALAQRQVNAALARASAEIAERRTTEAALRSAEQRISFALRAARAGAWEWDLHANAERWSPENYLVLGLPPGPPEGVYALWRDRIHPDDVAAVEAHIIGAFTERRELNIEFRILWPDGSLHWIQNIGQIMYDAAGEPLGMYGIQLDISARKMIEAELQRSELYYRTLIEDLPAMVCRFRADGTLTFVNNLYCRTFARTRAELTGFNFYELIPPADRAAAQAYIDRLTIDHPSATYEHRVFAPDGTERWQRWIDRALFDADGTVIEYQSIGEDVTERKQAEREREQLISELEARNAELEQFTYTVSHDLKSPLITIKGFVSYLEHDALAGNIERMCADITRINAAADRMHQLLDELLDLSRVGRLVNPPEVIALSELVTEAASSVCGQIEQRGVDLQIAPDLPAVYGDRNRLREVFQNLIDNAVKFMGTQPTPQICISMRNTPEEPVILVADNGIGIDERYHNRIFGLFERLDPSSTGTGIGLALVRRIIEVHGGRIWVESAGPGTGATFCLTLPAPPV